MAYDQTRIRIEEGIDRSFDRIAELFASKGETFDEEDAERLQTNPPSLPAFPMMITSLAVIKDLLDLPLDMTLILAIVAWSLSVFLGIALAFWTFGKISGGWWKKALIRWLWIRFFIMLSIELIPFLNLIPANTIFVLMAHYKETKIVKLFDQALEILHSGGAGRPGVTFTGAFRKGLQEQRSDNDGQSRNTAGAVRNVTRLAQSPVGKVVGTAAKVTPATRTALAAARVVSMAAVRQQQLERSRRAPNTLPQDATRTPTSRTTDKPQ